MTASPPTRAAPGLAAWCSAVLVVAAMAAVVAGGGGADPRAAVAWQSLAVGAGLLAALASAPKAARPVAAIGLALAAWIAVSASRGSVASDSAVQAAAWCGALLLAWAASRSFSAIERARPDLHATSTAVIVASASVIAIEVVAVAGLPLLGRAGGAQPQRPLGTFFDPNHLTQWLLLAAALNARRAALSTRWAEREVRQGGTAGEGADAGLAGGGGEAGGAPGRGFVHLALAVICAASALLTLSRIAAIAVPVLLALELHRRGATRRVLRSRSAMAALGAGVLAVAAGAVVTLHARKGEPDAFTRPLIWRAAAPAALESPVLGLGPAGFQQAWWTHQFPVRHGVGFYEKLPTTPHGEWLRLPIEIGFGGVLLAAILCAAVAWALAPRARELLPLAGVAATLGAVHDMFHAPSTGAWLLAGVGLALAERRGRDAEAPVVPMVRPGSGGAVALGLLAALLLAARVRFAQSERLLDVDGPAAAARALERDPWSPWALRRLADGLAPAGRAIDVPALRADIALAEAQRLAPRHPGIVTDRARLAARALADLVPEALTRDSAEALYRQAAGLAPRDAFVRVEAAVFLLVNGAPEPALDFASEALALEPAMTRAMAARVLALQGAGRTAEAGEARRELSAHVEATKGTVTDTAYQAQILEIEPDLLARALAVPAP